MKLTTTTFVASALLLQNAASHVVKRQASSISSSSTVASSISSSSTVASSTLSSSTVSSPTVSSSISSAIVSSATISSATSSATPVKNTGKRGLAFNQVNLTMPFSLSGQDSQVSWAYNWAEAYSGSDFNPAIEFIPMLWSNDASLLANWPTNAQAAIDNGATALLSFNEPDACWSGSACMGVNVSVEAYQNYMQPFAGKALLGSPAVTNSGSPGGLTWLESFIAECTNCTIDFITIHWYSNKWAGATYFKEQVEAARAIAGGRPIWITEFGLDDSDGTYDQDDLTAFLEEVLPWMDEQDDVHRYAYFMDTPGMLINTAGNDLSETGILYNNYTLVSSSSSSTSSAIATSTYTSSSTAPTTTNAAQTSTSATSPTSTNATSTRTSETSTSTAIQILSAYYADVEVTTAARSAFLEDGNLIINTNTLLTSLNISDPWPGTTKTLTILYTHSDSTLIFVATQDSNTYTFPADGISSGSMMVPDYAIMEDATIDIVAVVWGNGQIVEDAAYERIYSQQATGWGFQITDELFGVDTLWGTEKSAVIWYTDVKGTLKALAGKENDWVKF